jgi:Class II flagellar assembly regulator
MREPCQAGCEVSELKLQPNLNRPGAASAIDSAGTSRKAGKNCRALYRRLTIPAQAARAEKAREPMRIQGAGGTASAARPTAGARAATGSFNLAESDTARGTSAATNLRTISTIDALLALQGVEDVRERRKRAVAKGRNALDVLDQMKIAVLDGTLDTSTLSRLKVAADGLTDSSGDPKLDSVLSEIDLRVAVELAKAGLV